MTQEEALSILKTGVNVFLTGEPGSGKTHTVNAYVSWLREHGIEPSLTASTGIAATHIHGTTIHAWSGIGVLQQLDPMDLDRIASKEAVVRRLNKARVLIIDEISMLSGETLDMVDRVVREVRRSELPFGGMQVLFVGDFYQLPPIARGGTASFAFESRAWHAANTITCYLSEQHRHEDSGFSSILGAVRSGEWSAGEVSKIMSRETEHEVVEQDVPRLFTHNADVDRINEEQLEKIPGTPQVYVMDTEGASPLAEGLKRGCLSPERLVLKVGAIVMCTKNIPQLGVANGTLGTVVAFERGTQHPILETRDGRRVTLGKQDWAVEEGGKIRAKISQIPLRLAWAITVHKSQGMSLDAAAVDLSRTFEYGQGYVALSRVRTLSGLFVLGFTEDALRVHPRVMEEDASFRSASNAAAAAFHELTESGEREEMERRFVLASGGSLTKVTRTQATTASNTYEETRALLAAGLSLEETAKERGLTLGTILTHAESLTSGGLLTSKELEAIVPKRILSDLPAIQKALGAKKLLTPAFKKLKGEYTFDELRMARLLS